jgi:DNA-binding LacI/PurR family transcriptional regulator
VTQQARRRSSILDVARLAGVSKQTVSNVLNRRGGFTEDTRMRVESAMQELGYQPSSAARSMRSHRTMQLGYHLPGELLDPHTGLTVPLLQGLVRAAIERRHHVVVFTDEGTDELAGFRDLLGRRCVDAFLLSDGRLDDPRTRYLADAGVPFALLGRTAPDLPQAWVDVDNVGGQAAVVDYLVERGHRDIAYVAQPNRVSWYADRRDGYRAGMARHGLREPVPPVLEADEEALRAGIVELLRDKRRPTAVAAGSDVVAAMVMNIARGEGLRVGCDLAVTGFGGGPICSVLEPDLTSVEIPVDEVARAVVDRALREVEGGIGDVPGVVVPVRVVARASA